jgi:trans-aconitate methyltransferase
MDFDALYRWWHRLTLRRGRHGFEDSGAYWQQRYARGQDSGAGSYGRFAEFKAEVLNAWVREHAIRDVIEFGCGDGNQLRLAQYPRYLGLDISPVAIRACRKAFAQDASKRFLSLDDYRGEQAELAVSLDVIYHLVEDAVFEDYMRRLFGAGTRFVAIYSSDTDDNRDHSAPHLRHRRFTPWVAQHAPQWALARHVPNQYPYNGDPLTTSFADFFFYARRPGN